MEDDKVVEEELKQYEDILKQKRESESAMEVIKKAWIQVAVLFFIAFIFDNYNYLDYMYNQDNYRLCEGKIKKIKFNRKGSRKLTITYNLDGIIFEGTTTDYNVGDRVGDEITLIIKDNKIGRNQFIIGVPASIMLYALIIWFLGYCYVIIYRLKKQSEE